MENSGNKVTNSTIIMKKKRKNYHRIGYNVAMGRGPHYNMAIRKMQLLFLQLLLIISLSCENFFRIIVSFKYFHKFSLIL